VIAGIKGGAAAGIGVGLTLTFLVVNNLFLDIVSQQHDKQVAFADSGWSSMRPFLAVSQLKGLLVLVPGGLVSGALFGLLGAIVVRPLQVRAGRAS
jgi:hypothetical protein